MEKRPALFQYKIRTLLILMAVVALCLGVRGVPEDFRAMALLCESGTVVVVVAIVRRRLWLAVAGCIMVAGAIPGQAAVNCAPSSYELWGYLDRFWRYLGVPEDLRTMVFLCVVGVVIGVLALIRRRFRLALVGCVIVAAAIPIQAALNAPSRVDNTTLIVPIRVLDALTGKGVPGANVFGGNDKGPLTTTNPGGCASVSWTVSHWQSAPTLLVFAQGYEDTRVNIAGKIAWGVYLHCNVPAITIRLEKKKQANSGQPHSSPSAHQPRG